MGITIRHATRADSAAMADLVTQLAYPTTQDVVASRLEGLESEGQAVLVAVEGGSAQVVGLATMFVRRVIVDDSPFARLAALVVAEGERGRGVGRALVAEVERLAREQGCSSIEVTSGDHRPDAHRFYRALGFEERPRRFVKRLGAG